MVTTEASGIPEFYRNRDIYITGVTGFVGKVLLEKLLRTCDVQRIFVLVRPKRGLDPEERKKTLFKSRLFDNLRESKPQIFSKVHCVQGNLTEKNLGMDPKDIAAVTENVSVVFHLAASIKFEEPLRDSFSNNVEATKRVAELCRRMRQLVAFVHVSTAYCNCEKTDVEEKVYPLTETYDSVLKLLESSDDCYLDKMTPMLFEGRPNVYTLTKAIAESVLAEKYSDLPLVIVRPTIISSAWKEPLPGWVDSVNGATGIIAAAMKGILRTMVIYGEKVADFVPVDIVVNMLIATAWNVGNREKSSSNDVEVYHCSSGTVNQVTWNYLLRTLYPLVWRYPSQRVFIYPKGSFKRSYLWNEICVVLEHHFPACLVDLALCLIGKKPKLMNIQRRLHKAMNALGYFAKREWRFHSKNRIQLLENMSEEDRKNFEFDMANIDWEDYLTSYTFGVRRYLFKEDDSTIPEARKNISRNYFIAVGLQTFIVIGLIHCFITSQFVKTFLN